MLKIERKIAKLEKYLEILQEYKQDCKERFLNDTMFEGALLHYLYLISDGSIVLAKMVLKKQNINYAQSYYDAIDLLGENKILPKEFAYNFAKIATFRNFLAHDYENIDYIIICEDVLNRLDDIKQYLEYIKEFLIVDS